METFNKVPKVLCEQNADPVLFSFKNQMRGLPCDEENPATNPRYTHYRRNKRHIIKKDNILCRQNNNDVGEINHLQVL